MALHTIEICAGVGMLGEGLRAGLNYLGLKNRTVCYIEREAFAASILVARMEDESLDAAPVWPDLLTFDSHAWRGVVDCIAAGFPCQDLSLAGKRAGLDGARSGLFFNILDIADDCGARYLFLENVAGIASATASVVDEAEGALEERAAARVLGELADRGWNAEWLTLSASDVGASHGRARWFCLAWREGLDDTESRSVRIDEQNQRTRSRNGDSSAGASQSLANPESNRGYGQILCGLFAPGPADSRWPGIIASQPHLAPALSKEAESVLCGAPDGLATGLDFSHRAQRLKCVGNGVVALQAAASFVQLFRRAKG